MGRGGTVKFAENFAKVTAIAESACFGGLFDGNIFALQFQQGNFHFDFQQVFVSAFAAGFPENFAEVTAAVPCECGKIIQTHSGGNMGNDIPVDLFQQQLIGGGGT